MAVDAYDPSGNKSGKATLTTSTAPCPTAAVTFNSPAAGATVSGSIIWDVQPSIAFDHVDFLVDGTVKWTERTCRCEFNGDPNGRLDTTTLSNGSHVLKASAYDASGRRSLESSRSVTVDEHARHDHDHSDHDDHTDDDHYAPPRRPLRAAQVASPRQARAVTPTQPSTTSASRKERSLTNSGGINVTQNGAVINAVNVDRLDHGVSEQRDDPEQPDQLVNCAGGFAIREPNGYSGLTVKDTEINGGNVYARRRRRRS